jgi:hypothetical protein
MRKLIIFAVACAMLGLTMSVTAAAAPKGSLTCSPPDPGNANCEVSSDGKSATLTNANGGAALYLAKYSGKSFYSKLTSQVTTLQNTVGTLSGSPPSIDPRWSVPIDVGNDGDTDFFAFVAFGDCLTNGVTVDVIHDTTCTIYRQAESFPNWAAMVAAYPNDRVSYADYAFIIADGSGPLGEWAISGVKVGTNT